MKSFSFVLLLFVAISVSCHRKMYTAASTTTNATSTAANEPVKPLLDSTTAAGGTAMPSAPLAEPIIIVDSHGNFAVTEKDLPSGASSAILNNANARAYTPAELKTLTVRFKQIPPRILYVPASLQKTNSRGTYYVFAKKYYYWKKGSGYFYLDENYYK